VDMTGTKEVWNMAQVVSPCTVWHDLRKYSSEGVCHVGVTLFT
jgi:hypothetical protein